MGMQIKIKVLSAALLCTMAISTHAEKSPLTTAIKKSPLAEAAKKSLSPDVAVKSSEPDPHAVLIQKTITEVMNKYQIPGVAVELYVDGKPYEYYYGYADKTTKEPITRKTIFEVGALSKVMTGILLAQEIDWAKMSLTDPISKYIKDLPEAWNKIKLVDLATHTSGLPYNPPADLHSREDFTKYLLTSTPQQEPEEKWVYSNYGTGLLGYALEASTEKEFDKLYYRHVMIPLGMVVGVTIPPALTKYYSQGYDSHGNVVDHYDAKIFPAATGIKASAADMQRFLSAAIGLPGTPPRVFYPMRMTQSVYAKLGNDFQGLGWQIHPIIANDPASISRAESLDVSQRSIDDIYDRPTFDGDALVDKTGATRGFRAYIAVLPNKKSGIVILANKYVPNSAIVSPAREILFKLAELK